MKLKKTTVLTGNHGKRNRASSENDTNLLHFKGEIHGDAKNHASNDAAHGQEKKYVPKSKKHLDTPHEELNEYVAYRKKSHAV